MPDWFSYLLICVLILLSAFFSGSEIAFASANEYKLRKTAESGRERDKTALYIYDKYDKALISILIGNNLVNIASSSVATVIAIGLLGDAGTIAATAIMTVVILTFGEIIPKIVAAEQPNRFSGLFAMPIRGCMLLFSPLVWCINKLMTHISRLWESQQNSGPAVTEEDLETILDTAEEEGVLDEEACDLLQNALDFEDVLAYEIITPRVDMLAVDIDDPLEEILEKVLSSDFSRIPVYEETVDNIIGMLRHDQCLKLLASGEETSIRDMLLPAQFLYKTTPLPDALRMMRDSKCHMAIVTDEYGGTMGILTMDDVIEQLVGEIWDESDVIDEEFTELSEGHYEADGDMRLADFFDELDMDEEELDDDNATLGGWSIEMFGGYPKPGDAFRFQDYRITVKEVQGMRVLTLDVLHCPEITEETE